MGMGHGKGTGNREERKEKGQMLEEHRVQGVGWMRAAWRAKGE